MKTLIALACAAAVAAPTLAAEAPFDANAALRQARAESYGIRAGQYELAVPSVVALEAAVKAGPEDPRLWNALGTAYFQELTAAFNGKAKIDFPTVLRAATEAHAHALALKPDDPEALAGHGVALAIGSQFMRQPEMGKQGVAEMDRAVALAPKMILPRLQRGFTHLGVPASLRNPAAAEADLKFLIGISEGSRAADVMHVLAGDLMAEGGRVAEARAEYAMAARAGSRTQAMAQARLSGASTAADVATLRGVPARDCAMCHGG